MANRKVVPEFGEHAAGVFGGIGMRDAVVQVDLDFSPTGVAVVGKQVEQTLVVLLGGIKISVDERAAIVVTPGIDDLGILARPPFHAALLLGTRDAFLAICGIDGRLEVIGESKDDVNRAGGRRFQRTPWRSSPMSWCWPSSRIRSAVCWPIFAMASPRSIASSRLRPACRWRNWKPGWGRARASFA